MQEFVSITMNVTGITPDGGSSIMVRNLLMSSNLILVSAQESYNYLMEDLRDPRVDSWPLMASIWPTTLICIIYVYVVKVRYKKALGK